MAVGIAALVAPALHVITDVLEWYHDGFSTAKLWLNESAAGAHSLTRNPQGSHLSSSNLKPRPGFAHGCIQVPHCPGLGRRRRQPGRGNVPQHRWPLVAVT